MTIPTNDGILQLMDQLDHLIEDDLESNGLAYTLGWSERRHESNNRVWVCYFNADGGVVVFGVSDKNIRAEAIYRAKEYYLDTLRSGIFTRTNPHILFEIEELNVPERTCYLLINRIPKGSNSPYDASQGLFKQRIRKKCR